MRSIALLTQKGGSGKTTLAASLAVAAANAGERVIALDLDPQGSLWRWGKRRPTTKVKSQIIVEPLEPERLPRLQSILAGLAEAGFTLAIFDTPCADSATTRLVTDVVGICLLPARPACLDIEATSATFRAAFLAKRKAAFVLNQCPSSFRSTRAREAAKSLNRLGILAEPMLSARMDFQDAMAAGLGVTEYAEGSRAAQEIAMLWDWTWAQIAGNKVGYPPDRKTGGKAAA
jgi:chromosome partitioning protein